MITAVFKVTDVMATVFADEFPFPVQGTLDEITEVLIAIGLGKLAFAVKDPVIEHTFVFEAGAIRVLAHTGKLAFDKLALVMPVVNGGVGTLTI